MSDYQGKHRRDSEWAALQCRIRDLHDKVMPAEDRALGRHRDESDLALGRDILTAVGAL